MKMPGAYLAVIAATMVMFGAEALQAQHPGATPDFRLRTIRKDLVKAPNYQATATDTGGGRPATLYTDWLRIEAQFESRPEWADDVQLKFYVLLKDANDPAEPFKLFSGEITHVNVQKGTQHYSAMFVHPNTVRRFGGGRVEAVAVQLYYQGRLMGQLSDPASNERWWEKFSPKAGFVLSPLLTPWSVIASERYEQVKGQ